MRRYSEYKRNDINYLNNRAVELTGSAQEIDLAKSEHFKCIITGTTTMSIKGFNETALDAVFIELVNGGLGIISWPNEIKWMDPLGTMVDKPSLAKITFHSTASDWILLWSTNGGDTINAKVMR